ncbi:MAG TPA: hypothetical protein VI731_05540, partial [Bacteroidia bacterium]|nr:hypothetical protein [Bacteroidia bacterium]
VSGMNKPVSVKLSPKSFNLRPVTITSEQVTAWHAKDAWAFIDFAFYNDYVLALIGIRGQFKTYLVLLDSAGGNVATLQVPKQADSIYTDCLGENHLFSGDSVYQVWYDYEKLSLPYASERNSFAQTMMPCKCSDRLFYYFSYRRYHAQKLDLYYAIKPAPGSPNGLEPLLAIHDSAKIDAFNLNYDLAYFLELRRRHVGYLEPVDSMIAHLDFYREQLPLSVNEKQWLYPVHAPMVMCGSEMYLVHPLDSTLQCYTGATCVNKVYFAGMRLEGWKSELYADALTKSLYTRTINKQGISTFLRIDPQTGNVLSKTEVAKHPFIVNPQIRSGQLYFLWWDISSEQPVKLWTMYLN